MKRTWSKLKRGEKGQALVTVLILLAVGGLIAAPLLGFMSAGLLAGQVYEVEMDGLYAAGAGIEDACWKLMRGEVPEGAQPFCNLTDMNGMDVEVVQLGEPVDIGDGTLYTLESTATLPGETEPETTIIAQIIVEVGSVGEGGEGGQYKTNEEMAALSVLDQYNFIFTVQNSAEFWGREDNKGLPGTQVEPCDLAQLDFAEGHGSLWLDGDEVMDDPKYKINGVHFYHDDVTGLDYLLMTIKTVEDVGTPPELYNNNDIFRLHIDPLDPARFTTELLYTIDADLIGVSARGLGDDDDTNDVILFVMSDNSAFLGDPAIEFHNGDIIEYYPETGDYVLKVDTEAILGDIPNQPVLIFDCLSVLPEPDPRLLISFSSDAGVTGSNGVEIQAEDIAIWDPVDGIPNNGNDTINLHISMTQETEMNVVGNVIIVSWEIN